MLQAILNKSWMQLLTNEILYNGISYNQREYNEIRRTLLEKNELASDLLLWYSNHGKRSRGRPAKTYIDQLSSETGCER